MKTEKKRIEELDSLRGLAALMVFFYHVTTRYNELFGHQVNPLFSFDKGETGVYLFFIISGFVIFLTLNHTKSAQDFIVSRFSRLYPAYWCAIALTVITLGYFGLSGREVSLAQTLFNLTMLQEWFHIDHVDGVYWTLTIELSFYLMMLGLFISKQLPKMITIGLIWLGLIAGNIVLNDIVDVRLGTNLERLLVLEFGNLFIAGIYFYTLYFKDAGKKSALLLLPIFFALGLEYFLRPDTFHYVAGYFAAFYFFTRGWLTWLINKPLVYLGTISYSFYLIHQNISYVIINELYKTTWANAYSVIAIPLVITLAMASVICHCVEKPALKAIRNLWKNRQSNQLVVE